MLPLGRKPARAFTPVRPILAWYYGWYAGPASWVKTSDLPPELYGSCNDATMRRQIRKARAVGIDGFVCTWRYNCERLLDLAAKESGSGVTISIDPVATRVPTLKAVEAALRDVGQLTVHPACLREDGRPLIVFWASQILPQDSSIDAFRQLPEATDPNRA